MSNLSVDNSSNLFASIEATSTQTNAITDAPIFLAERRDRYVLYFEKMHPNAQIPKKNFDSDAGYDLCAFEDRLIHARSSAVVSTHIKAQMPDGVYGRVASRSGLAVKKNIEVGAGVIDNSYRGDIMVLLRNHSDTDYLVKTGDKIAQLILTPYVSAKVKEVSSLDTVFGETDRGNNGFGSSGK